MSNGHDPLVRLASAITAYNMSKMREMMEREEFRRIHGYEMPEPYPVTPGAKGDPAIEIVRRIWRMLRN